MAVSYTHLMQEFLSRSKTVEKMVLRLNRILMRDLKQEYPDVDYFDEEDLACLLYTSW